MVLAVFRSSNRRHHLARHRDALLRLLFLAMCLLLTAPAPLIAQEQPARLPRDLFKSGTEMRRAFQPVVADVGQSTVRVRKDGDDAALGVIVTADGWIITKASEIEEGDKLTVHLADGRAFDAVLTGMYPRADVALLRIEAANLPVVQWADHDVVIGQWAVTAGVGEEPLAIGIVAAQQRRVPEPAILGIVLNRTDQEARVRGVSPDTGAATAGLRSDDVITRVANHPVMTGDELIALIQDFRPGDVVRVHLLRGEEELELDITLSAPPSRRSDRSRFQNRLGGDLSQRHVGFEQAIQHDTVLRPADCGGPLVNLDGQAIGLNIARSGRTESYALPAPLVQRIVTEFQQGQHAVAPADAPPATELTASE